MSWKVIVESTSELKSAPFLPPHELESSKF